MATTSPQVPRGFEAITHLGTPVRVFSPWRNAVVYVTIPLLLLALGGLLWRVDESGGTPLPGWVWGMVGFWGAISVALAFYGYRRLRVWGVVYENGFAYTRGGPVMAFRWDDVVSVTLLPVRARYCHRVETVTGDRLLFDGNPDTMGRMVRDESFPARRRRLGEAFGRGDTVDFGRLSISRDGGTCSGDRVFPWGRMKGLRVRLGLLVLSMEDDSFLHAGGGNWALPLITNLDVLLDLAHEAGVDASRESVTELP
jgi:hypothetical protein